MTPYVQVQNQQSTLEQWKKILDGNELHSFAAFAYVTDSGAAEIRTRLKSYLGSSRKCRWLFSVDYGRSHPSALQKLKEIADSTIRIYDGEYVVHAKSFTPRVSFHLKTALTLQRDGYPRHQIVGSGNLSASGLLSGIEAGCVVDYSKIDEESGTNVLRALETLWENSTPLEKVIKEYAKRYKAITQMPISVPDDAYSPGTKLFWIDIGYVTKNRGADRPGNQFDLPRGSHVYLGVKKVQNPRRNSILGGLHIKTLDSQVVERTLRFGNNEMEKLTLPIPEDHGYHSYDGKILTFEVNGDEVMLDAYEPDDFYRIYGGRISFVGEMRGGRKYGTISLPNELGQV